MNGKCKQWVVTFNPQKCIKKLNTWNKRQTCSYTWHRNTHTHSFTTSLSNRIVKGPQCLQVWAYQQLICRMAANNHTFPTFVLGRQKSISRYFNLPHHILRGSSEARCCIHLVSDVQPDQLTKQLMGKDRPGLPCHAVSGVICARKKMVASFVLATTNTVLPNCKCILIFNPFVSLLYFTNYTLFEIPSTP